MKLSPFSNKDWIGCVDSRKSITRYCILLGDALISWKCKKQSTVAKSSPKNKYVTCEVQWLHFLLKDLPLPPSTITPIYCDNQSALHIDVNLIFHERTQHIEIDSHIVCEKTQTRVIDLLLVPSSAQIADIVTKAVLPAKFFHNCSKL